jgi:cobalt/nickel transport system permease protein
MHIPDGMLSPAISLITDAGALGIIGYSATWVRRFFDQQRIVLMAVLGALIFAFQMLNFPVGPGTSGHFMGGALAGIMFGPWAGAVLMSAVLIVQAFLLHDGGIVALGANVLSMAVVAPFVGYVFYRVATRVSDSRTMRLVGGFCGAWAATVGAALATALWLWLSGKANFGLVMGAMGFWHAIIGIAEGVITAGLLGYLLTVRPDLVDDTQTSAQTSMWKVLVTLGIITLVVGVLSFFASSRPDGLEFVWGTVLGYE